MKDIDISIIIPVYNAGRLIDRTIDSILRQKTHYTFEVICVDDGSKDNSVDKIKARDDSRIKLIQQSNAGPSSARNHGLRESQGRYIAFLDADDFWEDEFIENTVGFMENHSECIAVTVGQKHMSVSGESINPSCISDYDKPIVLEDFYVFWSEFNHVCTGSIIIRSTVIKECNGFREDLLCNEDWELWALLGSKGNWGFIPRILFTSDGINVTRTNGWIEKMEPRWYNAQSVEFWERRLMSESPKLRENPGYQRKVGIIASDIVYSLLLSQRERQARNEVLEYGYYFESNSLNRLFKFCAHSRLLWWTMCKVLKFREYHRNI